jgi:RNA polymerase sigma factor (sigma-70 family)
MSPAFEDFYRVSKDRCLRALVAALGDIDAAHEALDEAMVRACERWDRVAAHPNPEAWVVRTGINTYRAWWRRVRRSLPLVGEPITSDGPSGNLDGDLIAAVRALPRRQREVVALRLLLDLDTATTAKQLGIAPGTVTAHLHRAVTHLRETLGSQEEGGDDHE